MRWSILPAGLIAIALMSSGSASACNWTYDSGAATWPGDSSCLTLDTACFQDDACTGGAPPQAVDLALHCAGRAADTAMDVPSWAPSEAGLWIDFVTATSHGGYETAHGSTQPAQDDVNDVLCSQVWSFFCSNPVRTPACPLGEDPFGPGSPV